MRRRSFLSGLLSTTSLGRVRCGAIINVATPATAQVETAAAFKTIITAISVVKGISDIGRGDGGLSASLSAINAKLDLAILQISKLLVLVGDLVKQISELPDQLAEIVSDQYARELRHEVQAKIKKILDIEREATKDGISLEPGSPDRGGYRDRLLAAYNRFDEQRMLIIEAEEGAGPTGSIISEACLAVDALMLGYGMINERQFESACRNQVTWLQKMDNNDNFRSISARIANIDQVKRKEWHWELWTKWQRDHDLPARNAIEVVAGGSARGCVKAVAGVEYYTSGNYYRKAGASQTIMVGEYARTTYTTADTEMVGLSEHMGLYGVGFMNPYGRMQFLTPDGAAAEALASGLCITEDVGVIRIDYDRSRKLGILDSGVGESLWRTLQPAVLGTAGARSSEWEAVQRPELPESFRNKILAYLELWNLESLKRTFLVKCLDLAHQNRATAENFLSLFEEPLEEPL